jgi:serine phosphatase RsbU (regulator of sigma subunit)
MAEIKGMMSILVDVYHSPARLLTELNRLLYASFEKNLFTTMIYGVLDVQAGTFTFVRAGHNSLLFIPAQGRETMLTPPGIGLGLDSGDLFADKLKESTVRLHPGDKLLLFTDGITESMNASKAEFGEMRLLHIVNQNSGVSATELREKIFAEIQLFVDGASQHDDLTMIIIDTQAAGSS